MNRSRKVMMTASVATTLIAWGCVALAQQGPVTQGLNDAGRAVKRGFQSAGQAVQGSFIKTRTSVHNMEVVSRVYSRLHWDKTLTNSTIELEVRAGGIAILTGVVPDDYAKAKALTLTSETVGVVQVVDQLSVSTPSRPAPIVPGVTPSAPITAPLTSSPADVPL